MTSVTLPTGTCSECGFAWDLSYDDAVLIVGSAPLWCAKAFENAAFPSPPADVWSATEYLWHIVDVLRIGAERLWAIELDPAIGATPFDENALARVRSYDKQSRAVGLRALRKAADEVVSAARTAPRGARLEHPPLGHIGADDIVRRLAHEVVHHVMDVRRQRRPQS